MDFLKYSNTNVVLEQIIALMPGHVYWKDKNGIYLGCNDKQAHSLGLAKGSDLIGKTDFELPWGYHKAKIFRQNDLKVMKSKQGITIEEIANFEGKESVVLSHKVPLIDIAGEVTGILGVSIDITERKKAEEDKINTIIAMSASIAHELRTPLSVIALDSSGVNKHLPILIEGYELAKAADLPVKPIKSHHYNIMSNSLKSIRDETHYANTFINMLLIKTKKNNFDSKDFSKISITKTIQDTIARYPFRTTKEKESINLQLGEDFEYCGIPLLMIHVFFNLIKNSLYYIYSKAEGLIEIRLEKNKPYNKIYFRDNGKGIPKDQLTYVFQRFFSKTHNGTGLGLAFCKMVIQNLNGNIYCNSEEGKYTEFVIELPNIDKIIL